jgi:UDP-N-acetylglucosamine pyrophosphorylase
MKSGNLEAAMKTCSKRNAEEKVGVVATLDGKYHVAEYSEISETMMRQPVSESDPTLAYRHGSILIFGFST